MLQFPDALAAALTAIFFCGWVVASGRPPPIAAFMFFPILGWALLATGDLIARLTPAGSDLLDDAAGKLLAGLLAGGTWLYLLAWLTPISLGGNAALTLVGVLLARALVRRPTVQPRISADAASLTVVLVGLAAATLWSWDALTAVIPSGGEVVFKPWVDGFVHATNIRMFRDAHGAATIQDIRMAGERTYPYHFASYVIPALVAAATGVSAYAAFASFLVPIGVLAAALGAYVLVSAWWGKWPGVAAASALLTLPDAAQHGGGNPFFGYHWLLQISPTLGLGLASIALAWALAFVAFRTGRWRWLAGGAAVAVMCVNFKAQIFLANAALFALFPAAAMPGLRKEWRVGWVCAALGALFLGVLLSRHVPGVPELRFDPSSTRQYLALIASMADSGGLGLGGRLGAFGPDVTAARAFARGAALVLVSALGAFALAYPMLAWALRRRLPPAPLLFPAAVILNYLTMSLLLAQDRRGAGTPEELLHRPFVWAYCVTVAFIGGAVYILVSHHQVALGGLRRVALAGAVLMLTLVPWRLGRGVQVGPRWGSEFTNLKVPSGFVEAAAFLRTHSERGDVVQDSLGDPRFVMSALSERPGFAVDYFIRGTRPSPRLQARLENVQTLRGMNDEDALRTLAGRLGIRWYVSHPGDRLGWPASVLSRPAFESGEYRVYRLF